MLYISYSKKISKEDYWGSLLPPRQLTQAEPTTSLPSLLFSLQLYPAPSTPSPANQARDSYLSPACKRLWSPGINSNDSIPSAYVACVWILEQSMGTRNPPGYTGGIDSWAP
jgi:hypothetical protein